ncbi:MAG TPA: hypothetical protein P5346_06375 [Spirochaetota bacterium]|nr:hypothetical protein [Spirochaetota bacterium]HSA14356.1 hypothetical protein [Spirochaetota bacterium]
MPLISENVLKNAEKCKKFVGKVVLSIDKNNVLDEQMEALIRALSNVAPFEKDFEKVYGMKPYDYFMNPANRML